jgi:hypothetical protein
MRFFRPVFWPVWMHLGLNGNRFWFESVMMLLRFLAGILGFGVFHTKQKISLKISCDSPFNPAIIDDKC